MKKTLLIALLLFTGLIYSQTTQEEYNYLTQGLKVQDENGLDQTKKGYTLKSLSDKPLKLNYISFTAKKLIQNSTKKIKGISIIATMNKSGNKSYFAIPFSCNTCYNDYLKMVQNMPNDYKTEFMQALSYFLIITQ